MLRTFGIKGSLDKKICCFSFLSVFLLLTTIILIIFASIQQYNYKKLIASYENKFLELEETIDFCYETDYYLMFQFDLDVQYQEIIHKETLSNSDLGNGIRSLCNEWKNNGEKLYDLILKSEVDESFKGELEKSQAEWSEYIKNNIETKEKSFTSFSSFGSGSIVGVLIPKYEYKVYRARTLELLDMCFDHNILYIDCDELNVYLKLNDGQTVWTAKRQTRTQTN